jgi:hypothetical protein
VISLFIQDRATAGFGQMAHPPEEKRGLIRGIGSLLTWFFPILLSALLIQSCGYRFQESASELSPDIQSLAIPIFANRTIQTGIESEVTRALIARFISSKRLPVTSSQRADALLTGTVLSFTTFPVAVTTSTQVTSEYRATLTVEYILKRQSDGKILFREAISEWRNYSVEEDLAATESNKRRAIQEISVLLADRAYEFILLNF